MGNEERGTGSLREAKKEGRMNEPKGVLDRVTGSGLPS